MTNSKITRRAFLTSVMALVLCFAMLTGTTFAWFTDTETSGNNQIIAGNLDIAMYNALAEDIADDNRITTSTEDLFKDVALWEPGAVAYENVTVVNEGNLALKYQLSVNFTDNGLADALKVAVVDGGVSGYTNDDTGRTDLIDSITEWLPLTAFVKTGELKTNGEKNTYGLVIYWQPSDSDNNYNANDKSTAVEYSVDFGLKLFATQLNAENDAFGSDYDATAPIVKWDGTIAEVPAAVEGVITITTPAQLAGLAKAVNEGNNFAGKTIKLGADMDLDNIAWTPIGTKDANFNGTFDGNNRTIYNLNVTGTDGVGLIGIAGNSASIYNVNIENATVTGTHWVGTVLGYGYLSANSLAGCTVKNATVICEPVLNDDGKYDDGNQAGIIAGMAINGNIYNNKAIDSTVTAYRDLGGIVGCAQAENRSIKVYGNTVENVTVVRIDIDGEYVEEKPANCNAYVGRISEGTYTVTIGTNYGEETATVSETPAKVVSTTEELKTALATKNSIVILEAGEYEISSISEGVTVIAAEGTVVKATGNSAVPTRMTNNTFKNITFSGANGARYTYTHGDVVFENCTFDGETYGYHVDQAYGGTITFNNCEFIGFNAFAHDAKAYYFNNCTFTYNGTYGHTNMWSAGYFNNCTWGDKTSVSPAGDNGKLYFDGVEESYHHEFIGSADSLVDFAKSVNEDDDPWENQKVLLVNDIDLAGIDWEPIGQTGATVFKGIFDGQGYTISNLTIDSTAETGDHYSSALFGWIEGYATIKNVKIDGATVSGHHNCAVIAGYIYGKIENCHVTNATVVCTHANDEACGDKAGVIVGYAGPTADNVKITDCSATNCAVSAGRDAGQLIGAGYTGSVSGCSATNVTVTATGDCTGNYINTEIIGRVLGE